MIWQLRWFFLNKMLRFACPCKVSGMSRGLKLQVYVKQNHYCQLLLSNLFAYTIAVHFISMVLVKLLSIRVRLVCLQVKRISDSPTAGFPSVVILEWPTVSPFSQIHWSWTHGETNGQTADQHRPPSPAGQTHGSFIVVSAELYSGPTLDLSGQRKQQDSVSSCSVRPSCFISLRFSINCQTEKQIASVELCLVWAVTNRNAVLSLKQGCARVHV